MKHSLIPTEGNWYKANLHCHTTCSDGKMTPEEVKERYRSQGYSVIAFSDHNKIIDHSDLNDENFLALTAFEVDFSGKDSDLTWNANKQVHINMIAPRADEDRIVAARLRDDGTFDEVKAILPPQKYVCNSRFINKIVSAAVDNGYLTTLNHPAWSNLDYEDYAYLEKLWGVEVDNGGCRVIGRPDNADVLTKMLRAYQRDIYPISADDNHSAFPLDHPRCSSCRAWVNVRAEKLDYTSIFDALKRGDFYSSAGPEIYECYYDDEECAIHIKCSPAAAIYVNSDGIAGNQAYPEHMGETITEAVLPVRQDIGFEFIRVTVIDERGNRAHTKAFWLKK